MERQMDRRRENVRNEFVCIPGERLETIPVRLGIFSKCGRRLNNRILENRRRAVRKRVRKRGSGMYPFETILIERKALKERGSEPQGMDRRTDVVSESGE